MEKIKLNIGAGNLHIPGYLSLDLYNETADIKSDIDKIPLEDNSVAEIISYHVLEHVIPFKAEDAIKEWYRILMPGGKLILELPNIIPLCEDLPNVDFGEKFRLLNYMYGYGEHPGHSHLYGWFPESISGLLQKCDFVDIVFKEPENHLEAKKYCMRVEAIVSKNEVLDSFNNI